MALKLDIEQCNTFEEVAENKANAYSVASGSQLNIESILSGLYKDPTHFIFELIQNAEDAGAKNVSITLKETRLIFQHDGRPFTLRDIKGITSINYSEKAKDYTKIGQFGIGFKAVFSICNSPEIYSDEFNFRIKNFYVPERINNNLDGQVKGYTYIVLEFMKDKAQEIYTQIDNTLINLKSDTLLFLQNVQQIDYLSLGHCSFYKREKIEKSIGRHKYFECSIKEPAGVRSKYLVFEAPLKENPRLTISLAYSVDNESGEIIAEEESTKLVVFFPTEKETFLCFKVNGPYQTTPTRESVPETDGNKNILRQTVELYKQSIFALQELSQLNTELIEKLPLLPKQYGYGNSGNVFYDMFCEATSEIFSQYELLPVQDGGYTNADNALLARGPVIDLLEVNDRVQLFDGRNHWLSTDITRDVRPRLVQFLTSLKIPTVDYDAIFAKISKEFLQEKTEAWLIRFYSRGNKNVDTAKKYLTKEFIKSESGAFVSPFIRESRGVLQKNVYLPSKLVADKSKLIAPCFANNKEVLQFFDNIGIEAMDVVESIRTYWLPFIKNSKTEDEHYDNFYLLYLECEEQDSDTKGRIKQLMRNSECMLFTNDNGEIQFAEPSKFFMAHGAAKVLYDGYDKALFIYEKLDSEAQNDKRLAEFMKSIGVVEGITIIEENHRLSYSDRTEIMKNANYSSYRDTAYQIWGIDYILSNITISKSKVLWSELNSIPDEFFTGKLTWWYYGRSQAEHFEAYFVKKLQNSKWLYNSESECVAPNDVYEDEIRQLYGGGIALKHFRFKPDLIKQLPAEEQRRLELAKDIPIEVLEQMREQYIQLSSPISVDVNPEENPTIIEDAVFENSVDGLTSEELTATEDEVEEDITIVDDVLEQLYGNADIPDEVIEKIVVKRTTNEAELDGDLGERFVLTSLKQKYVDLGYQIYNDEKDGFSAKNGSDLFDVRRHNSQTHKQKGYDITITKNGDVVEYIEVKSKKSDEKELFKVSGLQWEFARKLYEEGNGDKHFVYVVSNVRDKERVKITKVSNPYKAWLDGDLEADPVRIRY